MKSYIYENIWNMKYMKYMKILEGSTLYEKWYSKSLALTTFQK